MVIGRLGDGLRGLRLLFRADQSDAVLYQEGHDLIALGNLGDRTVGELV